MTTESTASLRESSGRYGSWRLGYFESSEYGNKLTIMVFYPDGTYSIAERFYGEFAQDAIAYDVD